MPIEKGKAGTTTFDYQRNRPTPLRAALDLLDGGVIGHCMRRHRHQELIRFANAIDRTVPTGKVVPGILDHYGTHKQPKVMRRLGRHPRLVFHVTPTSCSWLNAVETVLPRLTRRQQRGVFHSIVDLPAAIDRFIEDHKAEPNRFAWTADANAILDQVTCRIRKLASVR